MLEKKYYKQDLCEDAGRCKLYNPLLTQGQCEYYNKMCELIDEVSEKDKQIKYLKDLCDKERLKITELQQQIKEEKTVFDMYRANTIQKGITDPEVTKTIRKQVCNEIRNSIEVAKLRYMWEGKSLEISKILDKIEGNANGK